MFRSKNKCNNCNRKLKGEYEFCPYCGISLKKRKDSKKEWGLLGKNDSINSEEPELKIPKGFNFVINSLMKNLEKQIRKTEKEIQKEKNLDNSEKQFKGNKKGVRIDFSNSGTKGPEVKIQSFGIPKELIEKNLQSLGIVPGNLKNQKQKKVFKRKLAKSKMFSIDKQKKFSKMKKKTPETNIKRLGDSVIYEFSVPGVKNKDDVSVIKLEESIEIKVIGKEVAYSKVLNVNFPILSYDLDKKSETLKLELGAE